MLTGRNTVAVGGNNSDTLLHAPVVATLAAFSPPFTLQQHVTAKNVLSKVMN